MVESNKCFAYLNLKIWTSTITAVAPMMLQLITKCSERVEIAEVHTTWLTGVLALYTASCKSNLVSLGQAPIKRAYIYIYYIEVVVKRILIA